MARGTLLLAAMAVTAAGCGTQAAPASKTDRAAAAAMDASLLSGREAPEGFLPAEQHRAFTGIRPGDPDCARLLRLADVADARDLRGVRDAPQAHTAFYLDKPGATLVEHVFRLPEGRAAQHLAEARRSIAACPRISMSVGDDREVRMRRERLRRPRGVQEAVTVRYSHGKGKERAGLDVLMARAGNDLLVVAAPGMFGAGGGKTLEKAEAKAVRKLKAVHRGQTKLVSPAPAGQP